MIKKLLFSKNKLKRRLLPFLSFSFDGKKFNYFSHQYNTTWLNERAVEIPIVWDFFQTQLAKKKKLKTLEIGNVLYHYFPISHSVVDKYETNNGAINKDIVQFTPKEKFDLIVSISTLEHVGYDEDKKDSQKIIKSMEKIRSLLKKGGEALITLPLGYNLNMDKQLKQGKIKFDKTFYMERISSENEWIQTTDKIVGSKKYSSPYLYANGLVIGILEK